MSDKERKGEITIIAGISKTSLCERPRLVRTIHDPGSLRIKRKGAENPRGKLSIVISLTAILISAISACYTYQQNAPHKRFFFQHITPKLSVDLTYSTAGVYRNPAFTIINNGPISVASIAIDYRCYLYDKKLKKVTSVIDMSDFRHEQTSFKNNLVPSESVTIELPGFHELFPDLIDVFVVQIRYSRASDLEEYNKTEIFFVERDRISRHESFMSSPYYGEIIRAIGPRGLAQARGDKEKSKSVIGRFWVVEN